MKQVKVAAALDLDNLRFSAVGHGRASARRFQPLYVLETGMARVCVLVVSVLVFASVPHVFRLASMMRTLG